MRFLKYLKEELDSEDWGITGKKFEKVFLKACRLINLEFEENRYAGRLWDFHPKGSKWDKLVSDKDVNIKIYGTKWMFGSTELYKILPWENLPEDFDVNIASNKVKKFLNKIGLNKIVFLKPKNKEIQTEIFNAVRLNDIEKIDRLMVKKNFLLNRLTNYNVRILSNKERITSIVIDFEGKVFMRSEKPRKIGAGKGSTMVTFRTPTPKISKKETEIKNKT